MYKTRNKNMTSHMYISHPDYNLLPEMHTILLKEISICLKWLRKIKFHTDI